VSPLQRDLQGTKIAWCRRETFGNSKGGRRVGTTRKKAPALPVIFEGRRLSCRRSAMSPEPSSGSGILFMQAVAEEPNATRSHHRPDLH
jgi:hypothetical protein